ncbi:UNVERIFIED_CONTAM: hypothetical protein FKN15_071032 [Acipenser sinensis]
MDSPVGASSPSDEEDCPSSLIVAHQTGHEKRVAPSLLTTERLYYKDWPTNKLLKLLLDNDMAIPVGSDCSTMFLQLCEAMSADLIFPPLPSARTRAQRPKAAASASTSKAPQRSPISIAASMPVTHEEIFKDIKGYLKPLVEAVTDIKARLDVIEGQPAAAVIPAPQRSLPQPDPEAATHFSLASASTSSQLSSAVHHYNVAPATNSSYRTAWNSYSQFCTQH